MKKINWKQLLIPPLLFVFILLLSGCGESNEAYPPLADREETILQYDEINDTWFVCVRTDNGQNLDCDVIYTKDEVQDLLDRQANEIEEMIYDSYVEYNEEDGVFYSNCLIVDGIKHCNIILDLNLIYDAMEYLDGGLGDDIEMYLYDKDQIDIMFDELEIQDIETNITYTTLAMLDIMIYLYDEELASGTVFSDEEVVYYDMLIMMRTEYITALENGE